MLLCHLEKIPPGAALAAPLSHPARPGRAVLPQGAPLDKPMLRRLQARGIAHAWIEHPATIDLNQLIDPSLGRARAAACAQLRAHAPAIAQGRLTGSHVVRYSQLVMDMICELRSCRDAPITIPPALSRRNDLPAHSANVAALALMIGQHLELYIVKQRDRLSSDHARDLTPLGIGALLHDIGKLNLPAPQRARHEIETAADENPDHAYLAHPRRGYDMLRATRAPASASQILLGHHQRYRGEGFPDVRNPASHRQDQAQTGQAIHVFSRIVALANVLENLLRNAPLPVVALAQLAGDRFTGWFDPVVLETALRRLPPFPIGSYVELSDARPAAVIAHNRHQPCRPVVRPLDQAIDPEADLPRLELAQMPELHIETCLGHPVADHLYSLPETRRAATSAA